MLDLFDIYCGGDAGEYNDKLNREKMTRAFGSPHFEDRIKLVACIAQTQTPCVRALSSMLTSVNSQI